MCQRVQCRKCGLATYAGCGAHVEQVLGGVPADKRCRCREAKQSASESKSGGPTRSWWSELLKR